MATKVFGVQLSYRMMVPWHVHAICNTIAQGEPDQQRWPAAADKVLVYAAPVLRVVPGRYFWSGKTYKPRTLAVYHSPDIILLLWLKIDREKVQQLPWGNGNTAEREPRVCLVVESAADSGTCKLRLSHLVISTSVTGRKEEQQNEPHHHASFEVLTPT
jgi:hypothetical protein